MSLTLCRHSFARSVAVCAIAVIVLVVTSSRLLAQAGDSSNFKRWDYDEKAKRNITQVGKILISGNIEPGQEIAFDDYYDHYSLGRWTQPGNEGALPKFRKELRDQLMQAKVGVAHNRLTDLILKKMTEAAFGNDFDLTVRVNAMLLIGELNLEDTSRPGATPTPLTAAVPILVKAVRDPALADPVRIAALVGLVRHATLSIASEQVSADVAAAALELTKSKSAPGRSAAGSSWMRARAIEILGLQGSVGANNVVAETLADILADTAARVPVRKAAAEAVGKLNFQNAVNFNPGKLAQGLGNLAVEAMETAARDLEQSKPGVTPRMKSAVYAAVAGVNALAGAAASPAQDRVLAIQQKLKQIDELLQKDNEDSVVATVTPYAADLKSFLAKP